METDIHPVKLIRKCIGCYYTSMDLNEMIHHINDICESAKKNKCPECSVKFGNKESLDKHILENHCDTGLKYVTSIFYQCDVCEFSDFRKDIVVNHIKNKVRQSEFECYHCPITFKSKKDLINHQNDHPTTPNIYYQCLECIIFVSHFKPAYDMHVLRNPECRQRNLKYVTMCQECM